LVELWFSFGNAFGKALKILLFSLCNKLFLEIALFLGICLHSPIWQMRLSDVLEGFRPFANLANGVNDVLKTLFEKLW